MSKTMKLKKLSVISMVVLMTISCLTIVTLAGSTGQIWLNADPGAKAQGGGWRAGGYITWGDFEPNAEIDFALVVENRGKDPLVDLRIAMAIHSEDPPTTSDDFYSIDIEGSTHYLSDFGSTEYNPFDETFGGRHQVYVGTDAIWDVYFHAPTIVPAKTTVYLAVTVTLGPDPSDDFEIHFDAFDTITEYKTPNGHDLTFVSGATLPGGVEGEPPVAVIIGGDRTVNEGDLVTFDGSSSYDPDGDPVPGIVSYEWDFDAELDSDGDGNFANDMDASGAVVSFTWYDDYEVDVALTVTDNDGMTDTAYVHVTVLNVDPTAEFLGAFIEFELSIRVAGEKWHNVELKVVTNYDADSETWDDEIGVLEVERWPGDPDDNPSSGDSIPLSIDISGVNTYTAIVTYDPYEDEGDAIMGDQPINGQLWGANPVWLIAEFPDGTVCKKHHTFNVQQSTNPEGRNSDHWNHVEPWIVPISIGAAAGIPIKFVASATDPGSDDLTFEWDWGDATMDSIVYLYDSVRGPDPAFPPGSPYEPLGAPWDPWYTNTTVGTTPPIFITDMTYHTYLVSGTFTVTLTVSDDDGGEAVFSFDLEVSDGFGCP